MSASPLPSAAAVRERSDGGGFERIRIPNPDYANHPAYGRQFGRPTVSTRIQALRTLWPAFREQMGIGTQPAIITQPKFEMSVEARRLHEQVVRNGAVAVRFDEDEIARLREHMRPFIAKIEQRKRSVPPEKRTFGDMVMPVKVKNQPGFFTDLGAALERHGVLAAASNYLGVQLEMRLAVKLQVTDPDDSPWQNHFTDVGCGNPPTMYMHIDSEPRFLKCMLYLNEVTPENGPFSYVLRTNNVKLSRFEYMVRKANDKSRLDKCDVHTRQLFAALPRFLQMKSEFGNDLLDTSPETAALIAGEYPFTSKDGHVILFDNNGIHRGLKVVRGERHAVQIQLRPPHELAAGAAAE